MPPRQKAEKPPTVATVVPEGDRRRSLEIIRDRLAQETDDTLWAQHKRECNCQCGMGDGRLLVALVKELRAVIAELDALPGSAKREQLDDIAASVSELDAHRRRRAPRRAGSAG